MNKILLKHPNDVFKAIKNRKSTQTSDIKTLQVGEKTYTDNNIADGFYDNISQLKTLHDVTSPSFERFSEDHRHIVEICKSGAKIPKLTEEKAEHLLRKIKPGVSDYFSVTAAHFLNGGTVAIQHFQFLLNTIIDNIEVCSVEEF